MESIGVMRATPIRVLAVIPGNGTGSSMIFARRQVRSLSELGLEMRVFFLENRVSLSQVLRAVRKLRSVIREFRPDIVHAHYGTVTSFVCACADRTPLVITFRGSDINRNESVSYPRFLIAHTLSQLSTIFAKRVICVSSQLKRRLWFRNKAMVLPSGVDLETFKPQRRAAVRQAMGWCEETPIVLFNGGYDARAKGLELVKKSVAHAQKKIGRIRLLVLDGTLSPDQMPSYLNAADCLVLASRYEGSPNIVKESLACNLPVVSVDVGDVAERLAGVQPSAIVPAVPEVMGSEIADVLRKRARSNGREKVSRCSEAYVATELLKIYAEIVGEETACLAGLAVETNSGAAN